MIFTCYKKNIENIKFYPSDIRRKKYFHYCYNGITVSPLIVALYMIYYGNISKDHIRDILRSKNNHICLDYDLGLFQ